MRDWCDLPQRGDRGGGEGGGGEEGEGGIARGNFTVKYESL